MEVAAIRIKVVRDLIDGAMVDEAQVISSVPAAAIRVVSRIRFVGRALSRTGAIRDFDGAFTFTIDVGGGSGGTVTGVGAAVVRDHAAWEAVAAIVIVAVRRVARHECAIGDTAQGTDAVV